MSAPRNVQVAARWIGVGIAAFTTAYLIKANILPNTPIPQVAMPAVNARDSFLKAAEAQVTKRGTFDIEQTFSATKTAPAPLAERRALVAQNEKAVALLREGLALPCVQPPMRSFNDNTPEYAAFRKLARTVCWTGNQLAEDGDRAEAARRFLDAVELGRAIPRGGPLIPALVGIAIEAIGRKHLWEIADTLDGPTARAAARRLVALEDERVPFSETLTEEKWAMRASMVEIANKRWGDGAEAMTLFGDPGETSPTSLWQRFAFGVAVTVADKPTILHNQATYMDALARQSALPYDPARPKPAIPGDLVNRVLLPVFEQAGFKDYTSRSDNALLIVYLALRAHKAERGAYPATLAELMAKGYLKALPTDAFSPEGAVLRYRREAPGRMTLYSVGPDADDDGGRSIVSKKSDGAPKRYVEAGQEGDQVARTNTY